MKKKLVGAMLVGVLSVAGFAVATTSTQNGQMQAKDGMGKGMRYGKGFEMFQNLNLTDAQKAEIKKIMDDERTQKQGDREAFKNLPSAEREKKMQESRDALNTKIRNVLTADQQKTFDAKNAEMQQKMEAAKKEFNLTADQQKKLMQDGKGFGKGLGMGCDDMGMGKEFKDGMGRDGQAPMTPPQN